MMYHLTCVFVLCWGFWAVSDIVYAAQGVSDINPRNSPLIVETLRQVLRIPGAAERGGRNGKRPPRPPRYMVQLYQQVTQGKHHLPRNANTVRSYMPVKVPGLNPEVLVYNVSGGVGEHVLGAWLHGSGAGGRGSGGGARRLSSGRPIRYLLYHLHQPEDVTKPPRYTDPVVTITVKDYDKEVEVTRAVREAVMGAHSNGRLLGVRVEELRHGRFHTKDPNKIHRWAPLLLVYSSDPAMLDLEALGINALNISHNELDFNSYKNINAHLKTQNGYNGLRTRRSIEDWSEFEEMFTEEHINANSVLVPNSQERDYLNTNSINRNAVLSNSRNKKPTRTSSSKSMNRNDPLHSNLIDNNLLVEDHFNEESSGVDSDGSKGSSKKSKSSSTNLLNTNELPIPLGHSKLPIDSTSEERVGHRRHRRRRKHRKNQKKDNLIPLPDDYTKSKWGEEENKKTKRKNKKRKNRRIPEEWMNAAQDLISNVASNSINPLGPSHSSPGAGACARQELTVDFEALGWNNWIVAPSSFNTYYCAGGCPNPLNKTLSGSNHAIIQSLMHSLGTHPEVPAPCCVPDKLDSITILAFDSDGERFVLKTYPKMTVNSCSCQ